MNATPSPLRIALGVALAIVYASAGCLENQLPTLDHVAIGRFTPAFGDAFRYESDSGEQIAGTFGGPAERLDSLLRPQQVVLLKYTYSNGGKNPVSVGFEEAFQPTTGQIVQQVATCGTMVANAAGTFACDDSRATVLLGADGYPGAFGAAPLWGVERSVTTLNLTGSDGDTMRLALMNKDKCETWSLEGGDTKSNLRRLPWTLTSGEMTICRDVPIPVVFTAGLMTPLRSEGSRATFRLVEYVGTGNPWGKSPTNGETSRALTPVEWKAPFFAQQEVPSLAFPVDEAHQAAMSKSTGYASVMQKPNAGLLSFGHFWGGGSSGPPALESRSYDAQLVAWAPGELPLKLVVTKRVGASLPTQYSVSGEQRLPGIGLDTWVATSAPLEDAILKSIDLTGNSFEYQIAGFTHDRGNRLPYWCVMQTRPNYQPGLVLSTSFIPNEASRDGPVLPLEAAFDGPTGRLLSIDLAPESLPFDSSFL